MAWQHRGEFDYPDWRLGGGVYALYFGRQLVYIGRTGNFRSRLQEHARVKPFDSMKLSYTKDRSEQVRRERRLLARLRPPLNVIVPSQPKQAGCL